MSQEQRNTLEGVPFYKMNGTGNDFVILDLRAELHALDAVQIAYLTDRNGAFGCDQLIALEERDGGVFMRIWNADGSPAEACGNATRCVAWLLMREQGTQHVHFQGASGKLSGTQVADFYTRVDMGRPALHWTDIPLSEQMDDTRFVDVKLGPIDAPVLWGPSVVNMGNPHCVFFVTDVATQALEKFGPLVENHPLFPEGTNVSIAQMGANETIRSRVWERGVGLTKACGTAACAVLVSACRRNLVGRKATVLTGGGELVVEWCAKDDHVYLAGAVELEHAGCLPCLPSLP